MQWDKVKCLKVGQPLLVGTAGGGKLKLTLSSATTVINPWPLQAMPPNDYVRYPSPLATYNEVLTSETQFRETLEKFHADMGSKFMIPVIGGKDLDLHRLFVQVTYRGGFCKVNKEKSWTEVYGAFKFPISATNSSYLVRKHYFSLLLHYERVYYLRAEAWSPSELDALQVASFPKKHRRRNEAGSSASTQKAGLKRPAESEPEVKAAPTVLGTIESKFDVGYYITGKLGSDTLHGVLYHAPPNLPPSQAAQSPPQQPVAAAATGTAEAAGKQTQQKRKKKAEMDKDPNKPKGNQSSYNYFFAKEHRRLRESYSGTKDGHKNISKEIGANWRKLSPAEKAVYDGLARADKERYDAQSEAYKERLKSGQMTQQILQLPITEPILHSSPVNAGAATLSSQYEEANIELSLGPSMPVQQTTFGPDLNVISVDDEADAAEGSASMETRASGDA